MDRGTPGGAPDERHRRSRLEALGRFALARRRAVLVGTIVFALLSSAASAGLVEKLSLAGFDDPGSESVRAADALDERFGVDSANLVLLVDAGKRSVDDAAVARTGRGLAQRLRREEGVERVESYWTSGETGRRLRSRDGREALILAQVAGDDDEGSEHIEKFIEGYRGDQGPVEVGVSGLGQLVLDTEKQISDDLAKAEAVALPLTLLALILVFRGVIAALLPLAIGILAILGTMLVLRVLAGVVDVSVFALNLATALGLGLAIDYSLFMVARYRDELRSGLGTSEAILASMRTAGRTIAFSALIVAVSLAALLVFPMYYLRSFAYAGVAVVAVAAIAAVLVLPALLSLIGPRIDKWSLRRRTARPEEERGFWYRFSTVVMRRPLPIATVCIAVLVLLLTPFFGASYSFSDDRNLPTSVESRQVSDRIRAEFPVRESGQLFVLSEEAPSGRALESQTRAYAGRLSRVEGVVAVDSVSGTFQDGKLVAPPSDAARQRYVREGATWLGVQSKVEAFSEDGERLVRELRAVPSPYPASVTGIPGRLVDTKSTLSERLPIAVAVIAIATFLVLLLMTGSVLVPIKALVVNTLSLTAIFGAMVFVFQEGNLKWLVGDFTVTDTINVLNPPLIFCVAFGLSMDYEVFMLSRIKEEYDRRRDNSASIAYGLQRTGPIITAAALLMAIVFTSFATSGVTNVKLIGVALALAVVMDATLVRAALVPAFMRLTGRWNWWAPSAVRRAQTRLGVEEGESLVREPAQAPR